MPKTIDIALPSLSFDSFKEQLLNDYHIIVLSRECSLLGRKEVLTGKAKFGIKSFEKKAKIFKRKFI